MTDQQRLQQLIRARNPVVSIVTNEEEDARALVVDTAMALGRELQVWSVVQGLREGLVAGARSIDGTEHPAAMLYHLAQADPAPIYLTLDLSAHLSDPRTLRALRDVIDRFEATGGMLVMLDHSADLPEVIATRATTLELSLPDERELEAIVRRAVREATVDGPIEIDVTRHALKTIIRNLRGLSRRQAERIILEMVLEDRSFKSDDVNHVLSRKRQLLHQGGLLEYVEAPTDLDQIGGLRRLKLWLAARREALSDEAQHFGLPAPKGVLLLGVQGAGKSLCAKAIATAWQMPLLRMDPGALYDRYIGESEKRLRDALRQAETMSPIVLWIDEMEKGFASAASQSTDGGLSKRMFGQLLTWMQERTAPVFLVATANDIEALPPEMLRKGRFDEIFFVDLPTLETRAAIFEIHLRKRKRDPASFDIPALAAASDGFSGAEIEQAVVAGMHDAFGARRSLRSEDILAALRESPPLSVTMRERVDRLRDWARGRCVAAD